MGRHGGAQVPSQIVALPEFSLLGQFSFGYLAKLGARATVRQVPGSLVPRGRTRVVARASSYVRTGGDGGTAGRIAKV